MTDDVEKMFEGIQEAIGKYENITKSCALYIYMNQITFDKLTEFAKAVTLYKEEPVFYTICGLKIIIKDNLETDNMFISDSRVKGKRKRYGFPVRWRTKGV